MLIAIVRDNMPCFTAGVSALESLPNGDTIVYYELNPRDQEKFRKMFGQHLLKGQVKLKSKVKGPLNSVRVSSESHPNSRSPPSHVDHARRANTSVLSHVRNSILLTTSRRKNNITMHSVRPSNRHSMNSASGLQHVYHCVPPRIKPPLRARRRLISLLGLHNMP